MDLDSIRSALEIGSSSGLPVLLFGHTGAGKTSFCRQVFPNSKVILNEEIEFSGLSIIHSLSKTAKVIIFENLSEESINKIKQVVLKKTLFGEDLDNFFIITSAKDFKELREFIKVEFPIPSVDEWLRWAERSAIHPLITKLAKEKSLLEKFRPKDLENLSRLLNTGVPSELLDALISPLVANSPELLNIIKDGYDDSIDFEKVISLHNEDFINRIKQTSSKNIEKFNDDLLQELKFDESIITKEKMISYLSSMDMTKSLKLLSGLLENEASFDYLNELLSDPSVKEKIDSML